MVNIDEYEGQLKGRQFYGPGSISEKELNDPNSITYALANGIYKSTGYTLGAGFIRAAAMHKVVSEMTDFKNLPEYTQFALLRLYERRREMSAEDFTNYKKEIVMDLTDLFYLNMHKNDTKITAKLIATTYIETSLALEQQVLATSY
ncbi:MAG: hypothetical protein AABW84_00160 [Nanoarchaeota archaeon]